MTKKMKQSKEQGRERGRAAFNCFSVERAASRVSYSYPNTANSLYEPRSRALMADVL